MQESNYKDLRSARWFAPHDLTGFVHRTAIQAEGFSRFALKARARIEPHYFQVLPNLEVGGVAELGLNIAGRSFTYYAQNSGTGDFRIGVSGTYLSAWKAGISYVGFIGASTRQPLADRDFVLLNLERTF